ncbi:hypothetical protein [Piscinibacter sakaiensis]|uniref:Uncharacterized protein n=2 Tax=Piscinibacter sakaiensis TaxID=1547922 RepID=A0A0K8P2V7_PISS1|nr:hypothetical protein [Piscinibacter sakaiensis]GAP36859.1 hypothetical protein ISF6_2699 [Piscinibacter sakaiensis]
MPQRYVASAAALLAGLVLSAPAWAVNCYSGAVVDIAVDNGGTLWVTTSSVPLHPLCNVSTKGPFTMDVNACNAALALLVSAKTAARAVSIQYATGSCEAPGPYSAFYVQLN